MSAFGGRNMMTGEASTSIDEIVGRATAPGGYPSVSSGSCPISTSKVSS
ncbi:hypothetical protein [Mycolicibacterium goodii]|uniref:Uncharacterized protein n=1 Tax=Mycolicibacterium goodii TaxID=134601 RepID=A0ABS6HPH7_MYCGD|nr:hypothetical protein [Mycolicibacterium goodii]MBU8818445.1 hypothetical protein [Mycolicibacterium goodii]MBU8824607.1 hypothetical protein [Mycolicibacterium goodii]MBU8830744.1 hypothetical protein [Mycolicibacterium goodii]MBU8837194.1 hypothetical protein [Mycolicibacterium goodii]